MESILKDKVKYITEQSFRNGKDFFMNKKGGCSRERTGTF
ncbi:hypothetical protein BAK_1516 [Bacillus anthracis str. A0389]|nr:Hypothetical Protein H9401_1352 [Bacillus anthracis str. H9401]EDS97672.1 hypothetical protein BAK_1516 [Bacillus anthracis str. A0389]